MNKRPFHKIDIAHYEEMEDMNWEENDSHLKEKLTSHQYDDSEFHSETKAWREGRQNGRGRAWNIESEA